MTPTTPHSNSTCPTPQTTTPLPGSDFRIIGLIGFAHGVSHFFHLLLPPLFPWLIADFQVGYAAVGVAMSVFFVVSGIGQALAGLLVDKIGSLNALYGGLALFILAALVLAAANSLTGIVVVAALAGLGNSIFHPADFSLLNQRVSMTRLPHAFSAHGLGGNLGWAIAPIFMAGLAGAVGWRVAALAAAGVAVFALALLLLNRRYLGVQAVATHEVAATAPVVKLQDILKVRAVWLCFAFFFCATFAFGGLQNYLPSILQHRFGFTVASAAAALSVLLFSGAVGMLAGGFLAHHREIDKIIAVFLALSAVLIFLLGFVSLANVVLLPLLALCGFSIGITGPSRDLLVRRAATQRFGKAAYGRVYGLVYSGLDLGLASAPLLLAGMMDLGRYATVLYVAALMQALAIFAAFTANAERQDRLEGA